MLRKNFRPWNLFAAMAIIVICALTGTAQFRAGLQGTVTDAAGGTIAGATVTLTSKETNQTQTTTTSDSGFYRFTGLAPGLYTLTIEQQGFKKRLVEDVKVDAESIKGQDIALEPGGITETVTVQADAQEIQTEDANIRKTITSEEVLQLPQTGRDPYQLLRTAPGIIGTGARSGSGGAVNLPNTSGPGGSNNSIFQTENQVPISANGQRVTSNDFQVDGTSANSQTWGGAAIITPSQESVKELQVTATTYSAEDGRNTGAQIKVITQNGTNNWHGSVFYHLNDPSLNAFNNFPRFIGTVPTEGPRKVLTKFHSYGGSVGGPLPFPRFGDGGGPYFESGKDRLFFFFSFEGTKDSTNEPYTSWVETPDLRQRIIAARPNTPTAQILSAAGVEPRISNLVTPTLNSSDPNSPRYVCGTNQLFVPGQAVSGGIDIGRIAGVYGQFANDTTPDGNPDLLCATFPNPRDSQARQFFARVDFNATKKDKIAFTSFWVPVDASSYDSNAQSRPMADFTSKRRNFAYGLIYVRDLSATSTNEARVNYSGWGFDELASNSTANFGLPRVEIEGIWGNRLRFGILQPGVFKDRQYDYRDVFTKVWGNHVLKLGGSFRRDVNKGGQVSGARPLYSFVRPWNFANGTPVFEAVTADLNGNPTANNTIYHTDDIAFFGQDDWKFKPNLTLNLGLRWEYFSPITTENGPIGNLVLDSNGGLAGARIETAQKLTNGDWDNFGPQFGVAWAPERFKSKFVIRGGGGIAYDRLANALLDNARRNPPNGQNFGLCCAFSATDAVFLQMNYAVSTDGGIFGYPRHPNLGGGVNPANGLPRQGAVEIYGAPRDLPNAYLYRYSLEGQYELPWKTVATLGYTGSMGRHFVRINPIFITGPSTNPNISSAYFASPDVNTSYNAMIAGLRTRFYKGLNVSMNYTFGKSLDNSSFEAPCGCTNQSFPVDQREEHGRSDFDVRHNFVASAVWDIPFYRSQKSWEGKLLGGWQVSTIITYNTGYPWTPRLFGCIQGTTTNQFCDPRPSALAANSPGVNPSSNSNDNFLRPGGIFGIPGTTIFSTAFNSSNPFASRPIIGRNTLFGPRYFDTDLSLVKRFGLPNVGFLGESAGIDVRFNFFNVFNNLNLEPFNTFSDPTRVQLQSFGTAIRGLSGRVGEFQIRFGF